MSLEQALEKNTAAIEKLIVLLTNPPVIEMKLADEEPAEDPAPKARRAKKEAAPAAPVGEHVEADPAPSPETGAAAASTTEAAAAPAEPLTYAQVQAATLAAVKAGKRAEVVAILEGYGVKRADQIPEHMWTGYLGRVEAL